MNHTYDDQRALWNGRAGQAWVQSQELLDGMLRPFEQLLVEAVAGAPSVARLLDVGCGTGSTTLAMARRLRDGHACVGVDISEPMLTAARERASRQGIRAQFVHADAQTHGFSPAAFDMIASRFGVMFFADPVAAFANLQRGAKPEAQLCFVAWRSAAENPFMTAAERAAAPLLPALPARPADGPGQFAFADARRIETILAQAGWVDVEVRAVDATCSFAAAQLSHYLTKLGPLGLVLEQLDEALRTRVLAAARDALEPYVSGDDVRFNAACWKVSARAAGSSA